uniref:LTD domain-containing protein n=1 Tax=Arion vulgaris TaxID=1028688 RepID=A0A0B7BEK0_9EUPU
MEYLFEKPEIYSKQSPPTHLQDKEGLQLLDDRLPPNVDHARELSHQVNDVNTSAFWRSSKHLHEEMSTLKNIYETELEKLRKEIEAYANERNSLQTQCRNQQTHIWELQSKLSLETDKNNTLLDEINVLHRKIGHLDSELQDTHLSLQQPEGSFNQLQESVNDLSMEVNHWKQRYEHEHLTNQEMDKKLQQMMNKADFSEQLHGQQIKYYQARLDIASATILNLETQIQDNKSAKMDISEMQNQITDKEKTEHNNCQMESNQQHSSNVTDLQKSTLKDATTEKHDNPEDNIQQLIRKFRDACDKMAVELSNVGEDEESRSVVNSEIEKLKVLLENEEKRLDVPVSIVSVPISQTKELNTAGVNEPLSTSFSEILLEIAHGKHNSGINSNLHQTLTDGATRETTAISQVLTSIPRITASSSLPVTLFRSTDYDLRSSYPYESGITSSLYPYEPSPPLDTFYIPDELHSVDGGSLASPTSGLHMPEVLPMTEPRYNYSPSTDQKQLYADRSLPLTSQVLDPIHASKNFIQGHRISTDNNGVEEAQTKENESILNTTNYEPSNDYDLPNEISHKNLPKDTLISASRPTSNPHKRQISSAGDYTDSTSSAIGDLKILEVSTDGKFVTILNDGPTVFELGGYMIQQIVGGYPVAVFRFPADTKFSSDSTITLWSAKNDPSVHNPPTDFFLKDQKKWVSGPQCTTVLCRANGEVVAWTLATHRFTKDAFLETSTHKESIDENDKNSSKYIEDIDTNNGDILKELKLDVGPKPDPVYLRRAKKQLPSLVPSKHPHGLNTVSPVHPHTGQPRPFFFGLPQKKYRSLRIGSKISRTIGSGQRTRSLAVEENEELSTKCVSTIGKTCEGPSPFMRPHSRFDSGLKQVCSQHHLDFLPPMPCAPQSAC